MLASNMFVCLRKGIDR